MNRQRRGNASARSVTTQGVFPVAFLAMVCWLAAPRAAHAQLDPNWGPFDYDPNVIWTWSDTEGWLQVDGSNKGGVIHIWSSDGKVYVNGQEIKSVGGFGIGPAQVEKLGVGAPTVNPPGHTLDLREVKGNQFTNLNRNDIVVNWDELIDTYYPSPISGSSGFSGWCPPAGCAAPVSYYVMVAVLLGPPIVWQRRRRTGG